MIPVPAGVRVWLATGHTDMRRGFPSLALLVQEQLNQDPYSGHLPARWRCRSIGGCLELIAAQKIPPTVCCVPHDHVLLMGRLVWSPRASCDRTIEVRGNLPTKGKPTGSGRRHCPAMTRGNGPSKLERQLTSVTPEKYGNLSVTFPSLGASGFFNRGTTTKGRGTKARCFQSASPPGRRRPTRPTPEFQTKGTPLSPMCFASHRD